MFNLNWGVGFYESPAVNFKNILALVILSLAELAMLVYKLHLDTNSIQTPSVVSAAVQGD